MLSHVELYVSDLERSMRFWTPFLARLGYETDPWAGGVNYRRGEQEPYLSLLEAPASHRAAGYHRKRVGLNHLAFRVDTAEEVDGLRAWAREAGHVLLYDDRYPCATGPGTYSLFCEDPDRFKVEVVALASH